MTARAKTHESARPNTPAGKETPFSAWYVDATRRTSFEETLWLRDEQSNGSYTLDVRTLAPMDGSQCLILGFEWVHTLKGESSPKTGKAQIELAGGAEGLRAFIGLLERGATHVTALGDLAPVRTRLPELVEQGPR